MKRIILLGSTGSIGQQTLDVLREHKRHFCLHSCSLGNDIELGIQIVREFNPVAIVVRTEKAKKAYKALFTIPIYVGDSGLIELFNHGGDILLNALSGFAGLKPTLTAIKKGIDIALANKETLVSAGDIVMREAKANGVNIIPVDSEHSAVFQCLYGEGMHHVRRIILTASGGSFRDLTREELEKVTLNDALKHPNWSMGNKITIDSATMMNKGLEVIEAHHLFNIPYEKIETIIHPSSIIHSMIEFEDLSLKAQMGYPDMRVPILSALAYPERLPLSGKPIDFTSLAPLTFKPMSLERFPCLEYAYKAGIAGGLMPTVLNAANEEAVALFLNQKIPFLAIETIVKTMLDRFENIHNPTLEDIMACDMKVRRAVLDYHKEVYTV